MIKKVRPSIQKITECYQIAHKVDSKYWGLYVDKIKPMGVWTLACWVSKEKTIRAMPIDYKAGFHVIKIKEEAETVLKSFRYIKDLVLLKVLCREIYIEGEWEILHPFWTKGRRIRFISCYVCKWTKVIGEVE
jgi:hypothetical protein|tara:strand:+ start:894 stop:1292 length:399 start_codon:yes stop_codon:yes gene_type:complete